MAEDHPHLPLPRAEPVRERRMGGGFGGKRKLADVPAHASKLRDDLSRVVADQPIGGFDPRLLLKLRVEGSVLDDLEAFPGVDVVSQEGEKILVLFADQQGIDTFRERLALLQAGETVTREGLLFAIDAVENWTAADRKGAVFARRPELAKQEVLELDVELWPVETQRNQAAEAFQNWAAKNGVEVLDQLVSLVVILFRVRVTGASLAELLNHRDVREVEIPPRWCLAPELVGLRIGDVAVGALPATATRVGVLDSGVNSNQPLMKEGVVMAESFLRGRGPEDENGHGTAVAGFVAFGDIEACADAKRFEPRVAIVSARILDADGSCPLAAKQLSDAITKLNDDYGVRIFNLSLGDEDHVYRGGRVKPLAAQLDHLARSRGLVIVVSTGNNRAPELHPAELRDRYPSRLLDHEAGILDPAPALNVLTVGALARHEASFSSHHSPKDPRHQALARRDQPAPFSRSGPGACKSIKPELVEYGGNWLANLGAGQVERRAAGELAIARDAVGNLFVRESGTSFAAPLVAHKAARLAERYPRASSHLLRALLVAAARPPQACAELKLKPAEQRVVAGHGRVELHRALASTEKQCSLVYEGELGLDEAHFFEIPLPDGYRSGKKRLRRLTVVVAHAPRVTLTRADYRASLLNFRVVAADDVEEVAKALSRGSDEEMPGELGGASIGINERKRGSVQRADFERLVLNKDLRDGTRRLFLAVAHEVRPWARNIGLTAEPYAVVVSLEDEANQRSRLYTELELQLRTRVRQRSTG